MGAGLSRLHVEGRFFLTNKKTATLLTRLFTRTPPLPLSFRATQEAQALLERRPHTYGAGGRKNGTSLCSTRLAARETESSKWQVSRFLLQTPSPDTMRPCRLQAGKDEEQRQTGVPFLKKKRQTGCVDSVPTPRLTSFSPKPERKFFTSVRATKGFLYRNQLRRCARKSCREKPVSTTEQKRTSSRSGRCPPSPSRCPHSKTDACSEGAEQMPSARKHTGPRPCFASREESSNSRSSCLGIGDVVPRRIKKSLELRGGSFFCSIFEKSGE